MSRGDGGGGETTKWTAEKWLLNIWSRPSIKRDYSTTPMTETVTGQCFLLEVVHAKHFSTLSDSAICYSEGKKFKVYRRYGSKRGAVFGDGFLAFLELAQKEIRKQISAEYQQEANRICRLIGLHSACLLALPEGYWYSTISDDPNGGLYSHGSHLLGRWEGNAAARGQIAAHDSDQARG